MPTGDSSLQVQAYSDEEPAKPAVVVVFGATGDLNARKIAPALYNLAKDKRISPDTVVLGVARRQRSDERFRDEMAEAIEAHSRRPLDRQLWQRFSRNWYYHVTHAREPKEYETLRDRLRELDDRHGTAGNRLYYLAMTPDLFTDIVEHIGEAGLNQPEPPGAYTRVVVEKPFGHDLASAARLNDFIHKYFGESSIFRIDHYLGKETVQNILVMRFSNSIFEPILSRHFVDNVQITTAEKVGMEGRRGPYYEGVGAVRDMIQNHMLQTLALLTMEPPVEMAGEAIRDEKVKLLRSLGAIPRDQLADRVVRGQYVAADGMDGYVDEKGVGDESRVETFAAVQCFVENWRWAGVPFYLRTGKRLPAKVSEVVVQFKREPIGLFQEAGCDMGGANHLHIRIAPKEGIALSFDAKVPGTKMLLRPVTMDMWYDNTFESATPEAYEHLILDVMQGDPTLFIRSDEVEAAWRFVDSVRRGFAGDGPTPLVRYKAGTWGPEEADRLFHDPYKRWHPLRQGVE